MRAITAVVIGLFCTAIVGVSVYTSRYTAQIEAQFPAIGEIVSVGGVATHVIRKGSSGTPIILLHGAGGNARELDTLLAPKLSSKHRVFSVDRPGHGYSQRLAHAEKLQTQASHIAGLIETLVPGEKAVVVGHSYGAAVTLRIALDRPELLKGIVLLAPVSHDLGEGNIAWYNRYSSIPVLGVVTSQLVTIFGPPQARAGLGHSFSPAAVPDKYYDQVGLGLLFRPPSFRANAQDMTALRNELLVQQDRYPELDLTTLVFSGSADISLDPTAHAGRLKQDVPDIQVIDFLNEGHVPHFRRGDDIAAGISKLADGPR